MAELLATRDLYLGGNRVGYITVRCRAGQHEIVSIDDSGLPPRGFEILHAKSRRVIRCDPNTGEALETYDSGAAAADALGADPSCIYKAADGLRATAVGFRWRRDRPVLAVVSAEALRGHTGPSQHEPCPIALTPAELAEFHLRLEVRALPYSRESYMHLLVKGLRAADPVPEEAVAASEKMVVINLSLRGASAVAALYWRRYHPRRGVPYLPGADLPGDKMFGEAMARFVQGVFDMPKWRVEALNDDLFRLGYAKLDHLADSAAPVDPDTAFRLAAHAVWHGEPQAALKILGPVDGPVLAVHPAACHLRARILASNGTASERDGVLIRSALDHASRLEYLHAMAEMANIAHRKKHLRYAAHFTGELLRYGTPLPGDVMLPDWVSPAPRCLVGQTSQITTNVVAFVESIRAAVVAGSINWTNRLFGGIDEEAFFVVPAKAAALEAAMAAGQSSVDGPDLLWSALAEAQRCIYGLSTPPDPTRALQLLRWASKVKLPPYTEPQVNQLDNSRMEACRTDILMLLASLLAPCESDKAPSLSNYAMARARTMLQAQHDDVPDPAAAAGAVSLAFHVWPKQGRIQAAMRCLPHAHLRCLVSDDDRASAFSYTALHADVLKNSLQRCYNHPRARYPTLQHVITVLLAKEPQQIPVARLGSFVDGKPLEPRHLSLASTATSVGQWRCTAGVYTVTVPPSLAASFRAMGLLRQQGNHGLRTSMEEAVGRELAQWLPSTLTRQAGSSTGVVVIVSRQTTPVLFERLEAARLLEGYNRDALVASLAEEGFVTGLVKVWSWGDAFK